MRKSNWLGGLCLLAACSGGTGSDHPGEGPDPRDPWNENSPDTLVRAEIEAIGVSGSTAIEIDLYEKDGDEPLVLGPADRLTVRAGEQEVTLEHEALFLPDRAHYSGPALTGYAAGTLIEITLRSEKWGDARAELILPEPMKMLMPTEDTAIDATQPIEITWEGGHAADHTEARYDLDCGSRLTSGSEGGSEDDGREVIDMEVDQLDGPCGLRLEAVRQRFGTLEGSWTGTAIASQVDFSLWELP
jgi:hypothetical protein